MIDVSTWSEFLAAVQVTDNIVNVTSDIQASALTEVIYINCSEINGNNCKIMGIKVENNNYFRTNTRTGCTIKDLNFVNISAVKRLFSIAYSCLLNFENCTFNGICNENFVECDSAKNNTFKNCSFALRGYDSSLTNSNGTDRKYIFENCDFMLYGTWKNMKLSDFNHSRLSGGTIANFSGVNNLSNSVINAVISGAVSLNGTDSIINADKVSGAVSGSINAVTSEQMIDIEYLNSIGFEVFPDVDSTE